MEPAPAAHHYHHRASLSRAHNAGPSPTLNTPPSYAYQAPPLTESAVAAPAALRNALRCMILFLNLSSA